MVVSPAAMPSDATMPKTWQICTQRMGKPANRKSFAPTKHRCPRPRRNRQSASNERRSQTCPYSVTASSLARRDQGAMFSMAIRTAQVDSIREMLENGTKIAYLDEPGALVLSFAACKAQEAQDALHNATDHYAAHADAEGQLMLEDAMEHQQATLEIISLLLAHGANSDEVYYPGDAHSAHHFKYKPRKLLHQAAIWNNAAMADLLLLYEADQNARDFNGWSPLHHAAASNNVATAEALLSRGAAMSFRDHSHPIDDTSADDNPSAEPLAAAAEAVHALLPFVDKLVLMQLKEQHVGLQNITPLHVAARADALDVCELLLSHGAGKHAQDQAGDTPLHAAAQHAGAAVVKLLLDNACNPVAENLLGKVPSDLASRPGNEEVMHLLVAACIEWQVVLRNHSAHPIQRSS